MFRQEGLQKEFSAAILDIIKIPGGVIIIPMLQVFHDMSSININLQNSLNRAYLKMSNIEKPCDHCIQAFRDCIKSMEQVILKLHRAPENIKICKLEIYALITMLRNGLLY